MTHSTNYDKLARISECPMNVCQMCVNQVNSLSCINLTKEPSNGDGNNLNN